MYFKIYLNRKELSIFHCITVFTVLFYQSILRVEFGNKVHIT